MSIKWTFEKVYCRSVQFVFYFGAYLLPFRKPELIEGEGSFKKLPNFIKEKGYKHAFVVTDKGIVDVGFIDEFKKLADSVGLKYTIWDTVEANPKTDNIADGAKKFKECCADCLVAIGGGSSIDTAKAIGAKYVKPKKDMDKFGGYLKVFKKIPMLFVVPTTAGTGSEVTVASVVTNRITHHKYSINDLFLVPYYSVMDPVLHTYMTPFLTATTGMDAMTHAVEAYLTNNRPSYCIKYCEEAVKTIHDNLENAYNNGQDINARREMLYASYKAGAAFTRCGVTYVHPLAHTLGGLYNVPHGLANSVILPNCLEAYGPKINKKLARLADICGLKGNTEAEKAKAFIDEIKRMNKSMNLPDKIEGILDKDIDQICTWALKEAHPMYQSPVLLNREDLKKIIAKYKA